jgi:hypothetical protein
MSILASLAVALVQVAQASSPTPARPAPEARARVALVELVVEDLKGNPIRDLRGNEVILKQDGRPEMVRSLTRRQRDGVYELRYEPLRAHLGAITIRLLRAGTKVRGPHGAFVVARWLEPIKDYEQPLLAALKAPGEKRDIDCDVGALLFESGPDGVHHAIVFDVPPRQLRCVDKDERRLCRATILARVLTRDGHVVGAQSIQRDLWMPQTPGPPEEALLDRAVIWTAHFHLRPDEYVLETALANGTLWNVQRRPLVVAGPAPGLRLSSPVLLQGSDVLLESEDVADNPLRVAGKALVPTVRSALVAGSAGMARFYVALYPDRAKAEPVTGTLELYGAGTLVAREPLNLPAPSASGVIDYSGTLDLQTLGPAWYEIKILATQADEHAEATLGLTLAPPPFAAGDSPDGATAGNDPLAPPSALRYVLIDSREPACTLYLAFPAARLTPIREDQARQIGAEIVAWDAFRADAASRIKSHVERYDGAAESQLIARVIGLLGRLGGPVGVTWDGRIATTSSDFQHAKRAYERAH